MPSPFATYRATAAAAVDRMMGEAVRIAPMVALPKREPSADPGRAVVEIVARFRLKPAEHDVGGKRIERGGISGLTKLQGAEASLSISPVEHPKVGYDLRDGDLVTLLAPAAGVWPRWVAMAPLPHAGGSLIIPLSRAP